MKVGVVGCGKVGAAVAYRLIHEDFVKEILLVDKNRPLGEGEALDIQAASILESGASVKICGLDELLDAEAVILSCGAKRRATQTRASLLEENAKIIKEVVTPLKEAKNTFFIVVTNPVEPLVQLLVQELGFCAKKTLGLGTFIDTVRLKSLLCKHLNLEHSQADVMVLGEHGEGMVFAESVARIRGKRIFESIVQQEWERLCMQTKGMGAKLIELKGGASWAVASCVCKLLSAIYNDTDEVFPLAVFIKCGHYGLEEVVKSVPVQLGREGIKKVLHIPLSIEEKEKIKG